MRRGTSCELPLPRRCRSSRRRTYWYLSTTKSLDERRPLKVSFHYSFCSSTTASALALTCSDRDLLLDDHGIPIRRPRHVSSSYHRSPDLTRRVSPYDDSSRINLQIAYPFHRQFDPAETRQKGSMDKSTIMGRFRPARQDDRAGELWFFVAITKGMAEGRVEQATESSHGVEDASRVEGGQSGFSRGELGKWVNKSLANDQLFGEDGL